MELWFDTHMRGYIVFEKSLRCHLQRHEKPSAGCSGWFRSFLGPRAMCVCGCHAAAVHRRIAAARGESMDLRPYAGGVTLEEAGANLVSAMAMLRAAEIGDET